MTTAKRTPVTLKDIAKIVGITPMVVSDVLKGRQDRVRASASTRQKILETASQLHYRPNSSARAMRRNQFHNIGYLTVRDPNDYTIEAVQSGICAKAHESNYQLIMVKHVSDWNPTEAEIPSIYREARLDSLIIDRFRHSLPKIAEDLLMTGGFPIVSYNEKRRNNAVYVDDVLGSAMLATHLVEQGYRKIAFINLEMDRVGKEHYSLTDRIKGYRQVMEKEGLPEFVTGIPVENRMPFMIQWLRESAPEAVICYSDNDTFLVQRALYEMRRRCPDDLALAGFNGENLAEMSPVPLTSVRIPFYAMGQAASEMAIRLAEDPQPIPSIKFRPELIIAESTRRRRSS